MKPIVTIHRFFQDKNQTSGTISILDNYNFPVYASLSLERGWMHNKKNVSCIPIGTYELVLEYSPRFKTELWEIKGVPNRSECKFHCANFWFELNGCISPGLRYMNINNDGYRDITNSNDALKAFHQALRGHKKATLIITAEPNIN